MGLFLTFYSVPLIHVSVLCQYHAVLITVAVYYSLKSERVIPPVLFFFLKIALAICVLIWFHINFKIICTSSVKNVMGILIEVASNLWIALGNMAILTILILSIQKHGISFLSFFFCIIFSFLPQCFIVFRV